MYPLLLVTVAVIQCGPLKLLIEAEDFEKSSPLEWKITQLAGPVGDFEFTVKDGTMHIGDWPCWPTTHCPGKPETKC